MNVDLLNVQFYYQNLFHPPLWKDQIQENGPLWGFDGISTANPGMVNVAPDDANGVNLSRIADPLGNGGFCLRHYADLSQPGAYVRSQAGIQGAWRKSVDDAASSPTGIYFEQQCFIPEVLNANNDYQSWLSLQDIHVVDANSNSNRSWLGLFVLPDGSMKVKLAWGGGLYVINRDQGTPPPISTVGLPVGQWFKLKTHFIRSAAPTTVIVTLNDAPILQWDGAINSMPTNVHVEFYDKLYAGSGTTTPWGKVIRYSRNVALRAA